jgi:hypothetical protein
VYEVTKTPSPVNPREKDLEERFNEIDGNIAGKDSLGFVGDNYLALRQKHKARSTTGSTFDTTTTTTTSTTTPRPPRIKTTDGQVSEDLKRINKLNNQISKLKSELDLLLHFNENVLDFDSSIVSQAAKTKVEDFFFGLSTTIDDMVPRKRGASASLRRQAAESVLEAGDDIAASLASTVDLGSSVDIALPNISMTVVKKVRGSVSSSSSWSTSLLDVRLPDQAALAGPDGSIALAFSSYSQLGDLMTAESQVSSPVLSVTSLGTRGEDRAGRRCRFLILLLVLLLLIPQVDGAGGASRVLCEARPGAPPQVGP